MFWWAVRVSFAIAMRSCRSCDSRDRRACCVAEIHVPAIVAFVALDVAAAVVRLAFAVRSRYAFLLDLIDVTLLRIWRAP